MLIQARRTRMAYGIGTTSRYREGVDPVELKRWHVEDRYWYTTGVFRKLVDCNQLVPVDEVVGDFSCCPMYSTLTSVVLNLYATSSNHARYTNEPGITQIASLTVDIPPGHIKNRVYYNVNVQLQFGKTELTMTAVNKQTGKSYKVAAAIVNHRVPRLPSSACSA
jgi:hypothetical protein